MSWSPGTVHGHLAGVRLAGEHLASDFLRGEKIICYLCYDILFYYLPGMKNKLGFKWQMELKISNVIFILFQIK